MKRIIPLFLMFFLGALPTLAAQNPIQVTSSEGYTVNILLTPVGVQVNTPCPNGYNYDVIFDYDISFTGPNAPSGGLYTLQGNLGCGASNLFLPLENGGGTGQATTTGNAYQSDCSVPATVDDLLCDQLVLQIDGPGIPNQQIDASSLLPVEFIAFVARNVGKAVQLDWATATETGSDYFEIQRARNDGDWQPLDRVYSAGDSNEPQAYSFLDEEAVAGDVYYRLKQVDLDGSFMYSPVVSTSFNTISGFEVFPNPATDWVSVTSAEKVELLDLTGRVVLSSANALRSGDKQMSFNVSELPAGIYLLRSESDTKRLIVR